MITRESWKEHKTLDAAIKAETDAGAKLPLEVSQDVYYDMLGCVPPYRMKDRATFDCALSLCGIDPKEVTHLFLVGEPWEHDRHGNPVCDTFFIRAERFYYAGRYAAA
jgi:hypothetical protein